MASSKKKKKKTENQSPEYLWKANESTVMGPNAYKSIWFSTRKEDGKRPPVNLNIGNLLCQITGVFMSSRRNAEAGKGHSVILVYDGENRGWGTNSKAISVEMKWKTKGS